MRGQHDHHRAGYWLDEEHYLEPLGAGAGPREALPRVLSAAAVVRDARGRLWQVRRRPSPAVAAAGVVLALAVMLALMLLGV
jgi:hypothetical protein